MAAAHYHAVDHCMPVWGCCVLTVTILLSEAGLNLFLK